jgi:type III secretion protein L
MSFLLVRQNASPRDLAAVVASTAKIIKASEYAELVQAQTLLAQALQEARDMSARSHGAYEAARQQGYDDGREAARQEHVREMIRLADARDRYVEAVEGQMVDLVMSTVTKIIDDFDDHGRLLAVVRGALAAVRAQKRVLLKAHSSHAVYLRAQAQSMLAGFPGIDYLDVAADDHLAKGTCRLETDVGAVQADIAGQLQALRSAFEHALARRTAPASDSVTAADPQDGSLG